MASILVCVSVAWLYFKQQQTLRQTSAIITTIHLARIELSKGLLYTMLGDDPQSAFSREEGLALLQQAAGSIEAATVAGSQYIPLSTSAFQESMADFQKRLLAFRESSASQAELEVELRVAFHNLEVQAEAVDTQSQQHLRDLRTRLDNEFYLTLTGAALLLVGVCAVLIVSIGAMRKAGAASMDREQKLQQLLQILPVGVSILGPDRNVVYNNPALREILRFTNEELASGKYRQRAYVSGDGSTMSLEDTASARAQKSGRPVLAQETGIILEDGETIWTSVSAVPVDFPDWKTVIVTTDLTERKMAETKLSESEESFAAIFENSPIVIAISRHVDGKISHLNTAFTDFYGYSRAEVLGKSTTELNLWVHPDDQQRFIAQMRTDNRVNNFETETRLKTGETRQVLVSGQMVQIGGEPSLMAQIVDITERKQAERSLQQSQRNLRLFVEYSPAAIAMFDREMRYIVASRRYLQDYNLPEQDLTGRSHYEVFPEISEEWKEIHRRCLSGAVERAEVDPFPRLDGTLDWVHWEIHPWRETGGEIGGVILFSEVITARKQAEEKLRVNEERFRLIAENAADVIWVLDPAAGKFSFVSPSVEKLRGYTPDEVLLQSMEEVLTPESLRLVSQSLAENIPQFIARGSGTMSFISEVDQPHKDGSIVQTEVTTTYLFNEQGQVEIIGVSRDITARKHEERLRAQLTERLDLATHSARMGIWDWDIPKNEIHWDEQMYALYGLEAGEFGRAYEAWLEGVHPEDREASNEASAAAVRGERDFDTEFRVLWPDGSVHWLQANGLVFRDEQGSPLRMVGVNVDITERKTMEAQLRENERKYRELVESANSAIIRWKSNGEFAFFNEYAQHFFGYSEEEILGKTVNILVPQTDSTGGDLSSLVHDVAVRPEQYVKIVNENVCRDGRRVWMAWTNRPVYDEQGQVVEILAVGVDVTELKKMEEELRRSNAELEQFAYVASHDLQEPLRTVAGMVQLLQRRYKGQMDARADEYIHFAVDASERMQNLINDLLDFSRVNRKGQSLEAVPVERALNAALANLKTALAESQARVIVNDLPMVNTDAGQLTQVFQNLVGNAIKFRGEKPLEINIGAEKIEEGWRFWVRDNGMGIEPQYFERIFLLFQRLHARSAYPGTGIGLALCKKIVERHGGKIWVESELNHGATFFFTLPER